MFLTGENDFNRAQTKVYHDRYLEEGFAHVSYLEVPGMAHAIPGGPAWFDRAIELLDAPLGERKG